MDPGMIFPKILFQTQTCSRHRKSMEDTICVRHYAGQKILDVSVAQPKTCHHKAGECVCEAWEVGNGG